MNTTARTIVREAGTALAVLAIYLLTLLAPLHQSAMLQADLAKLGYESVGFFSLCEEMPATGENDRQIPTAVKCPAAGIGKFEFVALLPPPIVVAPPVVGELFRHPPDRHVVAAGRPDHFGQSRAPPALV